MAVISLYNLFYSANLAVKPFPKLLIVTSISVARYSNSNDAVKQTN